MAAATSAGAAGPTPTLYEQMSIQFKAPEFTQYYGPLTERTVLDYFAQSPFYDKTCTNQMLRMQNIASFNTLVGRWTAKEEEEQLRKFTGTEYVVAIAMPPSLFIIQRRERTSDVETEDTATYYIINDAVMQGPDLYTVLGNRMTMAFNAISNSLAMAREAQPPLDLRSSTSGGRAWKVYQEAEEEEDEEGTATASNAEVALVDGPAATMSAAADGNDAIGNDDLTGETPLNTARVAGSDASLKRGSTERDNSIRNGMDKRVRVAN
ncbi:hypothetical protein K437DRAFT_262930 [Tilletiaria anomala UBC 951]|uniref:Mediator of RNA polymerase II transcription subunit 6 n=1 Tax=Tilletiaria anomala (strain ATCC 24038 / CBS 436.72 / UBC 951) TaxID=1037660 RepID=A0A066W3W4_TILAU|nr:uncharacterized protein K437DRAFT_262930 [Tilletiaria anomala UBC 951]KDN45455.1 hypothetical protein K437DRAFT_262930 [Tilletiaria anomala UBC 951]